MSSFGRYHAAIMNPRTGDGVEGRGEQEAEHGSDSGRSGERTRLVLHGGRGSKKQRSTVTVYQLN
ncbi:hypothetical protein AKJ16_DCAP00436 [Drosera capensis]